MSHKDIDSGVESALKKFTNDESYFKDPPDTSDDRNQRNIQNIRSNCGRCNASALMSRGGMNRMVRGSVGPCREDSRRIHTPLRFAEFSDPTVNPTDYHFYTVSGWRIALPRTLSRRDVRALLININRSGPRRFGFTRVADTIVPMFLSPGNRLSLARTKTRHGCAL